MLLEDQHDKTRVSALRHAAERLSLLSPEIVYDAIRTTLRSRGVRSREVLCAEIAALCPMIERLIGPDGLARVFDAIRNVGHGWK